MAILAGTQFIAGAKGLTVKRSRFENVGAGVFTNFAGSSNFYIADNTFIGRNDPNHLIGWAGEHVDEVQRRGGADLPAEDGVLRRREALRPRARGRLQLHRRLPRRHQHRDLRQPRRQCRQRARHSRRAALSAARVLGPPPGGDRLLQQLHHQLARQPDRDRRRHAQHPRAAEHVHQPRVARVLQPAVARRAGLLDSQHRLPPAGGLDAADQRVGGRAVLQQHHPVGDAGRRAPRTCTGATT